MEKKLKKIIEFYMVAASPWTFLSINRLKNLKTKYNVDILIIPLDIMSLFNKNNIKPVSQRPEAVQKNRINELTRWKTFLQIKMNTQPSYFPVDPSLSSKLIIAAMKEEVSNFTEKSFVLTKNLCDAVWINNKNIADKDSLITIANNSGFNGKRLLEYSQTDKVTKKLIENNNEAIKNNVFGVPTFIYDNELYWGQDRIEFLERHLDKNK